MPAPALSLPNILSVAETFCILEYVTESSPIDAVEAAAQVIPPTFAASAVKINPSVGALDTLRLASSTASSAILSFEIIFPARCIESIEPSTY